MTREQPSPMPYTPAPSITRTYRRADSEDWDGAYAWLTRLPEAREFDDPGPVEVIEETWQRTAVQRFWHLPEPWAMTCEFTDDDGDCPGADVNGRCTAPVTGWWRSPTGHWHQVCATHQATPPDTGRGADDVEGVDR